MLEASCRSFTFDRYGTIVRVPTGRTFVVRSLFILASALVIPVPAAWLAVREDVRVIRQRLRSSAAAEVPGGVVNAIVAAEDPCHFEHSRIHTVKTVVSTFAGSDLRSANGALRHASLVNQIARAELRRARPLERWREVLTVAFVEAASDPNQVVRAYAATAYFGQAGGRYILGVNDASRVYYGKALRELDAAECASLAATLRSPRVHAPNVRSPRAVGRRLVILAQMRRQGFITERTFTAAVAKVSAGG